MGTRPWKGEEHMLSLEGIGWTLPGGEQILKKIDLTVPDGKLTVVTGPNGGGKTSLAKLIAGVERPWRRAASCWMGKTSRIGM